MWIVSLQLMPYAVALKKKTWKFTVDHHLFIVFLHFIGHFEGRKNPGPRYQLWWEAPLATSCRIPGVAMATYHAEEVGFVDRHRSKVWFVLVLLEVIHLMNIQDVLGAEFFLISWKGKIPGGRQARLRKGPSFAKNEVLGVGPRLFRAVHPFIISKSAQNHIRSYETWLMLIPNLILFLISMSSSFKPGESSWLQPSSNLFPGAVGPGGSVSHPWPSIVTSSTLEMQWLGVYILCKCR